MHHSNINTSDTEVNRLLFEGLTKENEKGEIVAGLAQRWEISQDYKKITFYLIDNLNSCKETTWQSWAIDIG